MSIKELLAEHNRKSLAVVDALLSNPEYASALEALHHDNSVSMGKSHHGLMFAVNSDTPTGYVPGTTGELISSTIESATEEAQLRIMQIIAEELPELAARDLMRLAERINAQIEGEK